MVTHDTSMLTGRMRAGMRVLVQSKRTGHRFMGDVSLVESDRLAVTFIDGPHVDDTFRFERVSGTSFGEQFQIIHVY